MVIGQDFLEEVLSSQGSICVVGIKNKKVIQVFKDTIAEAIQQATQFDADGRDAYFACGRFKDSSSREQANVSGVKSLFVDIDCGEGKPYADKSDGLNALQKWCKELNFPRPTIVDSGRGLHVYWTLTDDATKDEWQAVANLFKAAQSQKEFDVDKAVSADSARILRVPGTHNYKDNPPAPVTVLYTGKPTTLAHMQTCLENAGIKVMPKAPPKSLTQPSFIDPIAAALMGNNSSKFQTLVVKSLKGTGCAQITKIVSEQATLEEPLWRAGLSIAVRCEDKVTAIHAMSNEHPEYDPAFTEKKASETKGPYTCETFEGLNAAGCKGCQYKSKITSPIQLGNFIKRDETENPEPTGIDKYLLPTNYPYPYFRGVNGGIYKTVQKVIKTKDGPITENEDVLIYQFDLFCRGRTTDIDRGDVVEVVLKLPHDTVRVFQMQTSDLQSRETARRILAFNGVALQPHFMELVVAYITDWVTFLEKSKKSEQSHNQMGWTEENTFILGEREITIGDDKYSPPSAATMHISSAIGTKGSLAEWESVIEHFGKPGRELQAFTIMLGFGAPLFKMFGDLEGAIFNVISKGSGTGKSTLLNGVTSIYGKPRKLTMMYKDTSNAIIQNLGVLQNLPACIDEITNLSPLQCSDLAYSVTQGRGKERMDRSANKLRVNHSTWQLVAICTANDSILDKVSLLKASYEGEKYRVLEANLVLDNAIDKAESDAIFLKLHENYGHAGAAYIDFVVKNYTGSKNKLLDIRRAFDKAANMKQVERYWSALVSLGMTGGTIAQRDLGLLRNFDMERIYKFMIKLIQQIREDTANSNADPESVLGGYLNKHVATNAIIIDSDSDLRMKVNTNLLPAPYMMPRGELLIRIEKNANKVYISTKSFRNYCAEGKTPYGGVFRSLRDQRLIIGTEKKRLGKGSKINAPAIDCLIIDSTHAAFELDLSGLLANNIDANNGTQVSTTTNAS